MKNLKVKWKLLVSYGVIFLLLLTLGVTSISVVNMMSKKSVEYAEHLVPAVEEVGTARRNMMSVRRYLLNAMLVTDEADYERVEDAMNTDREAMYASLDAVEALSPECSEAVDAAREKLQGVAAYTTQIMTLSKDFENPEATAQAYDIYLNTYAPAFTEAADMMAALSEQINQNVLQQEAKVIGARAVAIAIVLVIMAAGLAAVVVFTYCMLRYIMVPTRRLLEGAEALAAGDFQHATVTYDSEDEFGILAEKITTVMERIVFITKDLETGLQAIANGDFTKKSADDSQYQGEYTLLRDSVYQLTRILAQIMEKIETASSEVSGGAEQVANAAQALGQGATEQASSVQELAATLTDISNQVDLNAALVGETEGHVKQTVEEVALGTDRMHQMLAAMEKISAASSEIEKIIRNIENIAFQTNILALNAAVEAARAGEAGKGFAVVAEEVRRLAANTSEASKSTSELISNALHAVENGTSIAKDTAERFEKVNSIIGELAEKANSAARNSLSQSEALKQLVIGVDQISSVVQTNTATAEEGAAASEQLSAQARILHNLVSDFTGSDQAAERPRAGEWTPDAPAAPADLGLKY